LWISDRSAIRIPYVAGEEIDDTRHDIHIVRDQLRQHVPAEMAATTSSCEPVPYRPLVNDNVLYRSLSRRKCKPWGGLLRDRIPRARRWCLGNLNEVLEC